MGDNNFANGARFGPSKYGAVGAMQSAIIYAMQNGNLPDCLARITRPTHSGEAMGDHVLVNGQHFGPSHRPSKGLW